MRISLRKTSLIDYPGRVSSVLFFPLCNLRCPWCHNRELIIGGAKDLIDIEEGLAHIEKRRYVLGGVVLSGGEPCLWEELPLIIAKIKKLNLSVKLDTNGLFPSMLEKLFREEETRPDYIALDLKIAPSRYTELLPSPGESGPGEKKISPGEALIQSAALIRDSGIAHEYRTIALPRLCITEKDIEELAALTDNSPWYIRPFRAGNCLNPAWDNLEESEEEASVKLEALVSKVRALGKNGITI